MSINRFKRAVIKALSTPEFDIKETYPIERTLKNLKRPLLIPIYRRLDYKIYAEDREILTRVFDPKKGTEKHTIVFFHGGGWVTENIDSYNNICKYISKNTESTVVSVEYRLAPEHKFPQGFDDCYAATEAIYRKQQEGDVPRGRLILMGDSAGGNLAAAVSLKARDKGDFKVDAQVLIYPATYWNHSTTSPFESVRENGTDYLLTAKRVSDYMALYKNTDEDFKNPYFAPLMAEDFSKQPDTLIISAEFDPLRDEGEAYGERLKAAGNKVKVHRMRDALHGYLCMGPYHQHVRKTYELINEFLNNDMTKVDE